MVWVFCGGRWVVARVVVTKWGWSVRTHGGAHWVLLGISWFNGTGLLWNSIFSVKNIPFETLYFKSFKSQGIGHLCFIDKPGENIPFKTIDYKSFKSQRVGHLCFKYKTVKNISFETAEGYNKRLIYTP
jgi:hypothetical protein